MIAPSAPVPPSASRRVDDGATPARVLALAAGGAGLAWLGYRVVATRTGVPLAWWLPLFVLEAAVWVRFALYAWAAWRLPPPRPGRSTAAPTVDVIVCAHHESVDEVRTSLVGCASLWAAHQLVLVDDADRDDLAELARSLGVTRLTRPGVSGARSGALRHAVGQTDGELVVVLDAGAAPLPDLIDLVWPAFDGPDVAFVQPAVAYLNDDSVVHVDRTEHERRLEHEVLGPARSHRGGAVWRASGTVVRRRAFDDIGGPVATSTSDHATSLAFAAAGWTGVELAQVGSVALAPHDLKTLLAERRRWCQGRLETLGGRPSVWSRGLGGPARLAHAQQLADDLSAWVHLGLVGMLMGVLLSGQAPLSITAGELVVGFGPWAVAGPAAVVALGRGRLRRGERLRRDLVLWGARLRGGLGALVGWEQRAAATPRSGRDAGGIDAVHRLGALAAATLAVEVVVVVRLTDAVAGGPLPAIDGLTLVVGLVVAAAFLRPALAVLGVFVRRRQQRGLPRASVDLAARADGTLVRCVDLSVRGLSFVTTERPGVGDELAIELPLPAPDSSIEVVEATAEVRSVVPNADHSRWRVGCELGGVIDDDALDLIVTHCAVVLPFAAHRDHRAACAAAS